MNKWTRRLAVISAFTAGLAVAQGTNVPSCTKPLNPDADKSAPAVTPAPAREPLRPQLTPERMEEMKARRAQMPPRPQFTPEDMEKMRAQHEAIKKIGEQARNETDPDKKEALIAQLRTHLTAEADKRYEEQEKRFGQAEKDMPLMKERLAEMKKMKAARVEEQIQRILAGEPLRGPGMMRPDMMRPGMEKPTPVLK